MNAIVREDDLVARARIRDAAAAAHRVKASKGENIPGTWVGTCSCGWRGQVRGFKFARRDALAEACRHEIAAEQVALKAARLV